MRNFKTTKQLVKHVIQNNPKAGDDDKLLIAEVWYKEGYDDRLSLRQNLAEKSLTLPESITRARRKLRQEGEITESKEAEERRYKEYKDTTQQFSDGKAVSWLYDD